MNPFVPDITNYVVVVIHREKNNLASALSHLCYLPKTCMALTNLTSTTVNGIPAKKTTAQIGNAEIITVLEKGNIVYSFTLLKKSGYEGWYTETVKNQVYQAMLSSFSAT